jgi:hypothetical protein
MGRSQTPGGGAIQEQEIVSRLRKLADDVEQDLAYKFMSQSTDAEAPKREAEWRDLLQGVLASLRALANNVQEGS